MEVHFPPELESKLSRIAAERGRNTESLVFEAVERLVGQIASHDEWLPGEVEKGIAAADRANSSNTPTFER
jgi:predicted transcriptional regulator